MAFQKVYDHFSSRREQKYIECILRAMGDLGLSASVKSRALLYCIVCDASKSKGHGEYFHANNHIFSWIQIGKQIRLICVVYEVLSRSNF